MGNSTSYIEAPKDVFFDEKDQTEISNMLFYHPENSIDFLNEMIKQNEQLQVSDQERELFFAELKFGKDIFDTQKADICLGVCGGM